MGPHPAPLSLLLGLLVPVHVLAHSYFTCEPIRVPRCLDMAYNMTFFPNMMEHYDQDSAAIRMEPFMPLVNLQCSPDVHNFLCQAFVPACIEPNKVMVPCRALCKTVHADCHKDMAMFDLAWPPELQCDRLDECSTSDDSGTFPAKHATTPKTSASVRRDLGFWCPLPLKTLPGLGSSFLGAKDCAPPCANMYLKPNEVEFAKNFIGVLSVVCLCATLFTFLTFLIDVKRFRYPERPIIFYAVCYSFVSLIYFVGFLLGNNMACNRATLPGAVETVVLGSQNKGCTLLFMLLYFFSTAGTVWWVILTITWFLAAGPKWSCEAIEKKAVWFHSTAWGVPGALTVMLLALNKVEGDGISGVCFVGLYDLHALRYFVLAPLCVAVAVGLSFLLAGIVSLNNVRQVIQHDERNQGKLKKFMIRIGVFSGLYLLPLVALLGCYVYEQAHRGTWENTWINDRCQEYSIPCSYKKKELDRPNLSLFLIKYLMTLVVGISTVFWVGSKKTCSEWAFFFNRTRKKDPISESRRVLQESCDFFLKHNSRVQHKKKQYKHSSHKLKVISKSMGTSTGAATALGDGPGRASTSGEALGTSETPPVELVESRAASRGPKSEGKELAGVERRSKGGSSEKVSSHSDSFQRAPDGRTTSCDVTDGKQLTSSQLLNPTHHGSLKGSAPVLARLESKETAAPTLEAGAVCNALT
uniref:Frizzled-6 n=1 Tax=Paramormyrops kingsleyae TaxID=1676925 RepID=A0A3B3TDS3_9TELE|nr:frizzled-6 [Paramormyrops kingsleyae]XP_023670214.1 frizzled-6 [Paramormyrops kingsleyae]XP_023670224.1 frizzled-6 [Paramormyrops kingsleyae]